MYLNAAAAQIFFDDNIGHTASHIVDARDVRTGEPLAFQAGAPGSQIKRGGPHCARPCVHAQLH